MTARGPAHQAQPFFGSVFSGGADCSPRGLLGWRTSRGEGPRERPAGGLDLHVCVDTSPSSADPPAWSSINAATLLCSHSDPLLAAVLNHAKSKFVSAMVEEQ